MLSVIVCSSNPALRDLHERNVTKTVGTACEYLRVDNTAGNLGICAAYNLGVERARGDTLVFVHEDVFFLQRGWGPLVQAKFDADPSLGLVGLAGTTYLFADCRPWFHAGRPFLRGQVVHEHDGSQHLTVFSRDPADAEVVAADGLFLAIRRELFRDIRFDEQRFDKFHLYDMDICMQVRRTHRLMVTCDVKVKHLSGGHFDDTWRHFARRFIEKYVHDLPATCTTQVPDLRNRIDFETLSLPDYYPTITEEESPMTILQIHDSEQSSAFFAQPHKLLMVRYQPIREADQNLRPGWDLLFYAPQRDQLFVVLDYQRYPYLVPPLSLPVQPGLRQVEEIPFPLSVTGERLIPGLWDYSTTVHHLKRYQLARENLRPGSVLDCACGVGYGIQMMLHERTVVRAVGVDLSEFALDFSRRLVKDARAQFSQELPAERFDNVTCFETLEHVPDPYAFMASLLERLAPGGRFFLSVPTERWGGSHLNTFHMSNWNSSRLVRFLAGFFGKITLRYQRVFLLATDTFSASEIRADSWGPNEDEYLIAVLEEPRITPRPRTILRQNGSLRNALWTTPILDRVKRQDPSRDVLVVTEHNQVFIDNPHADLVLTPAWPGPIDVDLPAAATRRQWAETAESSLAGLGADDVAPGPRLYLSEGDLDLGTRMKAGTTTPLVACHALATLADRSWWHAFWQELLRRLRSGHSVVLLGEQEVFACEMDGVHSMVGKNVPLLALAGLLAKADLFVGPSASELAHLAAAVGTSGVMIGLGGSASELGPGSRFWEASVPAEASAAAATTPAGAVEFTLGLIDQAIRNPSATCSGQCVMVPALQPRRCPVCGGASFVERAVLWPALIEEWGLTPAEVRLIDRQQGLCCTTCRSNLRSMTLAAAMLREYGSSQTLADFVRSSEVADSACLLAINQAGTLTPWLSGFRHYTFVQYPDADMQSLRIADDSFDIVVHSDTLEHIPDPVRGLRECRRVLRPGGKLFFTIPIVPSRLTRRRAGLPPSYHGAQANSREYLVCSEYGADFFVDLVAAGFTRIHLHTLADLSSFGLVCTKDSSIAL